MSDDKLTIEHLKRKLIEAYTLLEACRPYVEQFHEQTVFGDGAKNVLKEIDKILDPK